MDTQVNREPLGFVNSGEPQSGPDSGYLEEGGIASIPPTRDSSKMGRYDGPPNSPNLTVLGEVETDEPWFADGLRFKCTGCGGCCTGSPGYVYLSKPDLERLSAHFNLTEEEFLQKHTRYIDGQYALLDKAGSYDCSFLKDKQCTVYEARPMQCRTFPWWIHHLRDPKDWEEAGKRCEGINHPDAPTIPSLHIQEQCLTYLDNLLEQNFDL